MVPISGGGTVEVTFGGLWFGTYTFTAIYSGDPGHGSSSAGITVNVTLF
jgi:hypothetical protein